MATATAMSNITAAAAMPPATAATLNVAPAADATTPTADAGAEAVPVGDAEILDDGDADAPCVAVVDGSIEVDARAVDDADADAEGPTEGVITYSGRGGVAFAEKNTSALE